MKRTVCLLLAVSMILASAAALAESPASQFGFKGWPYRQKTACPGGARSQATPAPTPRETPPAQGEQAASSSSRGDYTTTSVSMQEKKVWEMLNKDRAKNGLPALPLDGQLCALARMKACDMKENHYFAHQSPTYGNASQMLKTFGYAFRGVGENIAHHATVEKSQAAFMSSAAHRRNVLGRQWTQVGVGVCMDDQGFVYVTQLFAR